ncbi:MAG: sunset domain-containing protein [Mesorhizobium sp.]
MVDNVYKFRRIKHGAPARMRTLPQSSGRRGAGPLIIPIVLLAAGGLGYFGADLLQAASPAAKLLGIGCDIKGNISINTGARIYHVPGQKFYDETVISPRYGERWFCSEAEARSAGWRKARR